MTHDHREWNISPRDYPTSGSTRDQLEFLVRYAVLAPSGHNTQPWIFVAHSDRIELFADRSRALPVVDPEDRELTISCGAALHHLRLAARCFRHRDTVEVLPRGEDADLLAVMRLAGEHEPTLDERHAFDAIPLRRTNRSRFDDRPIDPGLLEVLASDASAEGTWLAPVRDDAREAVANLVAAGDRIQGADRRFRRELAAWVRSNRSRRGDGVPGYGFGVSDLRSMLGPLVLRTFDWGGGQAAKDRELVAGSPVLAVLGTPGDRPRDWLSCGQALARVLLRARAAGVWASFLNQPIEVAELRPQLAAAVGAPGEPQILLRMGFGPDVEPTPRRPLRDVLLEDWD